jgi:hypothetical protein
VSKLFEKRMRKKDEKIFDIFFSAIFEKSVGEGFEPLQYCCKDNSRRACEKGGSIFFSPERKTRKELASERGKWERGELKLVFEVKVYSVEYDQFGSHNIN